MPAISSSLSRKEREFIQRRESILNTALHLFAEKGFHKVSMSEIARDSEFSVGSLYNFFPNKEALYKAMILEKTGELCRHLDRVLHSDCDEVSKICQWVARKVDLYRENIGIFRLFFSETMGINAIARTRISSLLKEKQKKLRVDLSSLFATAMQKKLLPPMGDPMVLATALDGICNALLNAEEEKDFKDPITADTILNIFFAQVSLPQDRFQNKRTSASVSRKKILPSPSISP